MLNFSFDMSALALGVVLAIFGAIGVWFRSTNKNIKETAMLVAVVKSDLHGHEKVDDVRHAALEARVESVERRMNGHAVS